MVTFLSGGTGTPKLLWGADEVFSLEDSTVIANTGDDVELGGLHVSPDCDSVIFERADLLNRDTWWGIDEDPTTTNDDLRNIASRVGFSDSPHYLGPESQRSGRRLSKWRRFAGMPEFMTIGDRDRAHHIARTTLLNQGHSLTTVTKKLTDVYDIDTTVLPMSDDPVATIIHTPSGEIHFQEFLIHKGGEPTVCDVEFRGVDDASPTQGVIDAMQNAVVFGPSNPVTSLGPMIAMDTFAETLEHTAVVAVSPFRNGQAFSGPAGNLMRGIGTRPGTGALSTLIPQIDAFVVDQDDDVSIDRPVIRTDTNIECKHDAARVASACKDALERVA